MAPFTVECQLEPRGDKWNPFGTPDSNSVYYSVAKMYRYRFTNRLRSYLLGLRYAFYAFRSQPIVDTYTAYLEWKNER